MFSVFRPQVALRLLAHKIQSPQEKEALQALTVSNQNTHTYKYCNTLMMQILFKNLFVLNVSIENDLFYVLTFIVVLFLFYISVWANITSLFSCMGHLHSHAFHLL